MNVIIIAGKEEGQAYVDSYIESVKEDEVNASIKRLRDEGYRIFTVSEVVNRIDDIVGITT